MCAVVMISSGCVTSMNLSRLRSTVFGEPTAEHKRVMLAEAFSAGDQYESMSSMGGGIWPGVPRWIEVCAIELESLHNVRGREMRCECKGQTEFGCKLRTEETRSE